MTSRLFTDAELERLARPFGDLLADELADGADPSEALAVLDDAAAAYASGTSGFEAWAASVLAWAHDTHGPAALVPLAAATSTAMARRQRVPSASAAPLADVGAAVLAGDAAEAAAAFAAFEAGERYRHDVALDWVCVLLSEVYRSYGDAGLEASLRRTGDETLLAWMPRDVAKPPRDRLTRWARLLKGNFAVLSLAEDDEKFTITQDPCGSCGRQLVDCEYPGPLDLAIVAGAANLTRDGQPTTVYRTHAVVMHEVVPLERLGVPWPVVGCPAGTVAGPCTIHLYKRPDDQAALATVGDRTGRIPAP